MSNDLTDNSEEGTPRDFHRVFDSMEELEEYLGEDVDQIITTHDLPDDVGVRITVSPKEMHEIASALQTRKGDAARAGLTIENRIAVLQEYVMERLSVIKKNGVTVFG